MGTDNRFFGALRLLGLLAALLLSACGGGGGGEAVAPPVPQSITVQPVSTSVVAGTSAIFSVTVTGSAAATFQWQRSNNGGVSWADIAGAIASSYSIAVVDVSLSGYQFRVVISSGGSTVTSSPVTLTVSPATIAPSITVQPADQSVIAGGDAGFAVTATGTSVAYLWQLSADGTAWSNISGATSASLVLPAVLLAESGKRVRAVISNSAGSVTSNPALLTVTPAPVLPTITAQPQAATVVAPQSVSFTVAAAGSPAAYYWQVSVDGGASFADITGATAASFTLASTTAADSGKLYRVRVSNAAGQVISVTALLTVNPAAVPPVIVSQPYDQTVTAPATATFTVTASGTPSPTFLWQVSPDGGATYANINGATSSSYTTPATAATDSGRRLRAIVTNTAGSTTSNAATLTVLANVTVTKPLTAGMAHSCAVTRVGAALCWGANANGQLGDGTTTQRRSPVAVSGLSTTAIQAIAAGDSHTCALTVAGAVLCWGQNANGQLGDGTTTSRLVPVSVVGVTEATAIAVGSAHSCARRGDGTVMCWGANFNGQLGDSTQTDRPIPVPVSGLSSVTGIAAGTWHSCAAKTDGTVACWGANQYFQLGSEGATRFVPAVATGIASVTKIAAGAWDTCVTKADATMVCWGLSIHGQLGAGTTGFNSAFAPVLGLVGVISAVPGTYLTCAVTASHAASCWGSQTSTTGGSGFVPATVTSLGNVADIAAGAGHVCVSYTGGTVACWGVNDSGQVGDATTTFRSSPATVPGLTLN